MLNNKNDLKLVNVKKLVNNMTDFLPCDIFKMILNMRTEAMRDDKYKNNYNKVINEINMINAIIIKDDDNERDNNYHYDYDDFKSDIFNDFLDDDLLDNYYQNKISYDELRNHIIDGCDEGFFCYETTFNCKCDDITYLYMCYNNTHPNHNYHNNESFNNNKHFKYYFNDYDDDLHKTYLLNKDKIYKIILKILKY